MDGRRKDEQETGNRKQETGNRKPGLRRGSDLAERLLTLAVGVLRVAAELPKNSAGRHVANQLVRAGTSAGANYEEARAAESREDFVHKVGIAAKEARETAFWLGLADRSGWLTTDTACPLREAIELAAILGASARTARSRSTRKSPSPDQEGSKG